MGPDHDKVALALLYQGAAMCKSGTKELGTEATPLLERCLATLERGPGGQHRLEYAVATDALAGVRRLAGRHEESIAMMRRVLNMWELVGPEAADGIEGGCARVNLGRAVLRDDKPQDAITIVCPGVHALVRHLGESHGEVAWARNALGAAYRHADEPELCLRVLQAALPVLEASFGPQHREVLPALTGVGWALIQLGRPQEAIPYLEHALLIMPDARGDDLPKGQQGIKSARELLEDAKAAIRVGAFAQLQNGNEELAASQHGIDELA